MIFKNFNGKQENHKDETKDLTLDEEFEQIFFNPKDSVLNDNNNSSENNNNNNTKNNSNNSNNSNNDNNYNLDMNDFIFFSEDEQDELESKNSQPPSRSAQSHDKFTVSPYNEYISPVSFSNHSLNTLTTKESSAAILGRKTYLDSAYKKFSNSTHSLMFRNESITSNIHLTNNTINNNNCLSSENSNTNSVITPQSGFYSPEKKVFPLQNSPCFDSQRIAEHEDLKRRKRTILADKLSSRFRSSDHRNEKDITIVKKEGRIHKMISNFTNKQKKTTPTTLDNNSNNEEEEDDNVKSNNDNNNKNNLNNSSNNGGRAVSETSTLKTRTRNNSQFSLSAGSEKHLMSTMFKMSHISQRPNSNSISPTTTANSIPEQHQNNNNDNNNNINHQQLKPDLDLELSDASLAFKLARTRTKSGGNNINMGS